MITVTNKYIPAFKKRFSSSSSKDLAIAETEGGDVAFYSTHIPSHKKRKYNVFSFDESDDDDSEDDMYHDRGSDITSKDFLFGKPVESITGEQWVPKFNDRLTMFIAGTPGAGKSYLAKQMINLLPTNLKILLFTALDEKDGNFDEYGKERLFKIKMTPEVLKKITLKAIREKVDATQAILLFDDVDKIRDPKVSNLAFAIMNDALANGRGHEKHDGDGDIHVICTSHSANDYQKTKYTFENSNYVALFPGTTPPLQMYRMFDKLGLDKDLCLRMIKLARAQKIRSIIVHKVVPMYMIFGNQIMLL